MTDAELLLDATQRALRYIESLDTRRVFPDNLALEQLAKFKETLPETGTDEARIIEQLDSLGSPATVASGGPSYFGFVIGGTLPIADAAERLTLAWDQVASGGTTSPAAHAIEKIAGAWILDLLDLPRESAVGFGTSASACGLSCLATARRTLLKNSGWDIDEDGVCGAPNIRILVSEKVHITILKALRVLGFGQKDITFVSCDTHGRIRTDSLPPVDQHTIVCLQAGEVNTGEFDLFQAIIPRLKEQGAWVHVDGAFGLWARCSKTHYHLTRGVELADSWTTDGHKWLNTPYDGAMAICRHADALATTLNADAVYSASEAFAQKNLTLEFSRKARGIPIWAALKYLGRNRLSHMVEKHCGLAKRIATELNTSGYEVINRVVLNQVLVRCKTDEMTLSALKIAQNSGKAWFGHSVWEGRPAFRISVSSWRTEQSHIDKFSELMSNIADQVGI